MGIEFVMNGPTNWLLSTLEVQPSVLEEIQASQKDDAKLEKLGQNVAHGKLPGFVIHEDENF